MTGACRFSVVILCLSACAHFGGSGSARAEAVTIPPAQYKAGDVAVEPSSKGNTHQVPDEDRLRYAQNTDAGQSAQLALSGEKKWRFSITPYIWLIGLDGDVGVRGVESDVDVGFDDLLENMDFAGSVHLEARRGKWGIFFDPNYAQLSMDADVGPASINVEVDFALIEFGVFYRAFDRDLGSSGRFRLATEPLVGARWTYLKSDIEFAGPPPPPDVDKSKDWLDLIVGVRNILTLSPKWSLNTRTDIGGFGIGDSSDFAWNSQILFGYQMTKRSTLYFGYRLLDMDYDEGSGSTEFTYDVTISGPIIGTKIQF